jgi:hypothetical protein
MANNHAAAVDAITERLEDYIAPTRHPLAFWQPSDGLLDMAADLDSVTVALSLLLSGAPLSQSQFAALLANGVRDIGPLIWRYAHHSDRLAILDGFMTRGGAIEEM